MCTHSKICIYKKDQTIFKTHLKPFTFLFIFTKSKRYYKKSCFFLLRSLYFYNIFSKILRHLNYFFNFIPLKCDHDINFSEMKKTHFKPNLCLTHIQIVLVCIMIFLIGLSLRPTQPPPQRLFNFIFMHLLI